MRKSQLLYISAVTICLLRNGTEAAGTTARQSPPRRASGPLLSRLAGPCHSSPRYFASRTYKANDAFLFA